MLNNLPDLNRLSVFYWIYKLGGIASASNTLHVTRSAVSQNLAKLEKELGCALFKRERQRLVPTSQGKELFAHTEPFMVELENQVKEIRHAHAQVSGQIRFSSPLRFFVGQVAPAIAAFRKKHPHVNFEVTPSGEEAARLLAEDKLDFCIMDSIEFPNPILKSATRQLLFRSSSVMVCSRSYFQKRLKTAAPKLEEILKAEFISYQRDASDVQAWIQRAYRKKVALRSPLIYMDSVFAIRRAVELGLGLGLIQSNLIAKELREGSLVAIGPDRAAVPSELSLVKVDGRSQTAAVRAFTAFLFDSITSSNRGPG